MPDYLGNWLECRNRNCGFPTRVPGAARARGRSGRGGKAVTFLFACPACLQANYYSSSNLRKVRFRTPDPYRAGRLALYSARFGCAHRGCPNALEVFTVAATSLSVVLLLRFWECWEIKVRCAPGHCFRVPGPELWWIEEKQPPALADSDGRCPKNRPFLQE